MRVPMLLGLSCLALLTPNRSWSQETAVEAPSEEVADEKQPTAAQQLYLDFLAEEGYRPYVDDDGDVGFKFEGGSYFVVVDEDDDQFFRVIYPAFWDIEDDAERDRALVAIEEVNSSVKTGKIYLVRDRAWAGVESFVPERDDFKPIFDRSLSALQTTWKQFGELMRAE